MHAQLVIFFLIIVGFIFVPGVTALDDLKPRVAQSLTALPLSLPSPKPYPVKKIEQAAPRLSAHAVLALDFDTQAVLVSENPDLLVSPASLIKLLTAVVALDHCVPEKVLTTAIPIPLVADESRIGLLSDEQMTVENLLYAMLLPSGNDAAQTLAAGCRSADKTFVDLMNEKAAKLGMTQTRVTNVFGRDEVGNVTTAADLATLSKVVIETPLLQTIVATPYKLVTDASGTHRHALFSTNVLLRAGQALGIKTGTTDEAKQNFIGLVPLAKDQKMYVVVLGSMNRFGEAQAIRQFVQEAYQWQLPALPLNAFVRQFALEPDQD